MRWTKKAKKEKWVDERVITKFLMLPLCIRKEVRFFERATIKQIKVSGTWVNTRWMN
jgi:hypothetical protein